MKAGGKFFQACFAGAMPHRCRCEHTNHFIKKTFPFKSKTDFRAATFNLYVGNGSPCFFRFIGSPKRKGREIMSAGKEGAGLLDCFQIQILGNMPGAVGFQWMNGRPIPNRVAIDFALGRKPGMKIGCGFLYPHQPNVLGEVGIDRVGPSAQIQAPIRDVRVRGLAFGMNAGIRSSRTVNDDSWLAEFGKSFFQVVLNRVATALALPPFKCGAVIGDIQAEPHATESSQL